MSTVRHHELSVQLMAHIEINSPTGDSKIDYFNRKQRYSISTQAVSGGNPKFLDIATG